MKGRLGSWLALACFCIGLLALVVLQTGPIVSNLYSHDVLLLLDGAWRIVNGQVPHNDYYSPIGGFTQYLIALPMGLLGSHSVWAIPYGCLLYAVVLLWVSFAMLRERLEVWVAVSISICLALLVVAPRPLGIGDFEHLTYAMLYNRHAAAFLLLVCFALLLPKRSGRGGLVVAGMALGCLVFTKLNYVAAGVGVLGVSVFLDLVSRVPAKQLFRQLGIVCATTLCVTGVLFVASGIRPSAYLTDLLLSAHSQNFEHRIDLLSRRFAYSTLPICCLVAVTIVGVSGPKISDKLRFLLLGTFFIGLWLIMALGNYQEGEFPVLACGVVVLFSHLSGEEDGRFRLLGATLSIAFFAATAVRDGGALLKQTFRIGVSNRANQGQKFESKSLEAWQVSEPQLVRYVNSGSNLLREHGLKPEEVFVVDFLNPFAFALLEPPPRSTLLWWDPYKSFSPKSFPPAEKVFESIQWVLIPREARDARGSRMIQNIYSRYLHEHFEQSKTVHDRGWRVFSRRQL